MKILIIGDDGRREELLQKLNLQQHDVMLADTGDVQQGFIDNSTVIFDLSADEDAGSFRKYASAEGKVVFAGSVRKQLAAMAAEAGTDVTCSLAGIINIPTFINRKKLEISLFDDVAKEQVVNVLQQLNVEFEICADRVGLVSPRLVLMIINEACYTLQEGTAGVEDIDKAMKLGTNYPYGPFEWADRIGIKNIYETLQAIFEDTRDERYKICPLLKTQFLKMRKFYHTEVSRLNA